MGPDEHARERDSDRREGDRLVAEDRLAREDGDDLREDPEGRQHHDVDLGVTEEPEHVLPEERTAVVAGLGVEEVRPGLAVEEQKRRGCADRGKRDHEEDRVRLDGPDEQREPHPCHPGGAHVVDRHDEVDRPEDRGDARQMDAEDPEVLADLRAVGLLRERRIGRPAGRRCAAVRGEAAEDHEAAEQKEPVGGGVEARERHVARPDHERDHEVRESGQHRHDEQEDHGRPVDREQLVVGVLRHDVLLRRRELGPHEEGHHPAGDEEGERGHDVEQADPLVVDRRQPAQDLALLPDRRDALSPNRQRTLLRSTGPAARSRAPCSS